MPAEPDTSPRTHAKVVATIGPASDSAALVRRLILAGVSVFRLNFSHGSFEEHERRIATIRGVAADLNRPVACLADLPGPKIRVGRVPDPGITLEPGQDVVFRNDLAVARVEMHGGVPVAVFPTTYPDLIADVREGQRVLINDGAIRMLAVESRPDQLRCVVKVGGLVTSNKGINLPESDIRASAITDRDWEIARFALTQGIDYLALSFVRSAAEIRALQDRLWEWVCAECADPALRSPIPVIAKIEKPQALANIDAIAEAADGIMVARGDLGVEMDIATVPVAQKRILDSCHRYGKPCIVATQMLETMINSPVPTRAEASDVANAVFDGADAVMLSGETAVGKYPEITVQTMRRIIAAAEARLAETHAHVQNAPTTLLPAHRLTAALAHSAWQAARDLGATAIVCWSQNAGTARYVSQQDFHIPIVAFTSDARAARRMALYRGVLPITSEPPTSGRLSDWNQLVDQVLLTSGLAKRDDWIVLLAGRPLGQAKRTNTLTVHKVGEAEGGFFGQ